jgi:hypothetical protein
MRNSLKWFIVAVAVALLPALQAGAVTMSRLAAEFLNFDGSETFSSTAACGPDTPTRTGCSVASTPGSGGTLVYKKSLMVPGGTKVLYVTLSAVGDNHGGESNFLSCNIDGPSGVGSASTVCNPLPSTVGTAVDGAPEGWTTLTHHFAYDTDYGSDGVTGLTVGDGGGGTSDEHDNDYYYTWCIPIKKSGTHTINLRLGNFSGPTTAVGPSSTVFFEKAFVFVDGSGTPPGGACIKHVFSAS